ncbi:alternative ribosome rescue aminoacyl-tRNA hydrolase ArfB [Cyclobacterium marinum]|uniref:Class I peptide chain release factor n=2 Tax=Cyclobacterium marinum TaxID=104 RepID=G0J5I2_CYCMS|nr:alternative ribosome rescue aminoacyl-tRNA hydrolase ArfB [Cyclobacterium marinum]AEL28431.1 Class I peptide chain release factor [Cyclobacterium marinum DSM 745]MBI0398282.1 aminoacyl-tRNA hydrolase [Cyclobacterium marinum]|tara:strand:+ start:1377 stop:1793 length:417 start_codon:yes stop_codon:yes gene_type:complete
MTIKDKIKNEIFHSEFNFQASRSSGPGGQNVNKVNSRVTLFFNVPISQFLSDEEKELLMAKYFNKMDKEGNLQFDAQSSRSQLDNKKTVQRKFYEFLEKAFEKKKKRKATRPSKAAKEKRLKAKRVRSEKKAMRSKDF